MSLVSCPECSRHIRTNETACPFCRADVTEAMANAVPRAIPAAGLSRAAMMAFAAASLGAASCSSSDTTGGGTQPLRDGATDGAHPGTGGSANTGGQMAMPLYGAVFPTGGTNSGVGGVQAMYGGPPPPQNTGGIMAVPAYGISPIPASGGTSNVGGTPNTGTGGIMAQPLYGASPIPTAKP